MYKTKEAPTAGATQAQLLGFLRRPASGGEDVREAQARPRSRSLVGASLEAIMTEENMTLKHSSGASPVASLEEV